MDQSALLLNQLFRAHHNACMAALAQRGVGDVGSPRLLLQLAQYPDGPEGAPTQKELADKLHSAPATIAASLKVLERQGYVTRRVDQADSRRNRIFITPKGRDTVEPIFQRSIRSVAAARGSFSRPALPARRPIPQKGSVTHAETHRVLLKGL